MCSFVYTRHPRTCFLPTLFAVHALRVIATLGLVHPVALCNMQTNVSEPNGFFFEQTPLLFACYVLHLNCFLSCYSVMQLVQHKFTLRCFLSPVLGFLGIRFVPGTTFVKPSLVTQNQTRWNCVRCTHCDTWPPLIGLVAGGWVLPIRIAYFVQRMANAAARGQALLAAPVSFQPCTPQFSFQVCFISFASGILTAVLILVAWILTLWHLRFMQQRQLPVWRPTIAYRPLQSLTPTSSYILAGGGPAVFIQHNILSCLYNSEGPNADIQSFGLCAPAVKLVTQSWTKVDTPSVSSRTKPNGFDFWD